MADALTMTAVAKRYGARVALDGVDLAVPTGSVFGLVGRNGAGKSTLIKCALGLIRPTVGEIRVLGDAPRALTDATKALRGESARTSALSMMMLGCYAPAIALQFSLVRSGWICVAALVAGAIVAPLAWRRLIRIDID